MISNSRSAFMVLFVSCCAAVEPGLPSRTSLAVAFHRAIGAKNPDPALRNPDELAIRFLGRRERALMQDYPMDALDLDYDAALQRHPNPPMVTLMVYRTRYIDEAFLAALRDGARQIVILGAEFDSRGYRFRDRLRGVRFFEVDYGPTQEYKKQRLKDIFGAVPQHVRFVPVNFTKDDLLTRLRDSGYSEKKQTFFVWEGVTMYLPATAIQSTLRFVRAHAAPRSAIVFDYLLSTHPNINNPKTMQARWGEPAIFGFSGNGAAEFVRREGLEVVDDALAVDPQSTKYVRRSDGSSSLPDWGTDIPSKAGRCIARVPQGRS